MAIGCAASAKSFCFTLEHVPDGGEIDSSESLRARVR